MSQSRTGYTTHCSIPPRPKRSRPPTELHRLQAAAPHRRLASGSPGCAQATVSLLTLKQGPLPAAGLTCSHWNEVPPVSCMVDRANRNKSQVIVDTVTEHLEPQGATDYA
jgi:hypothetical protein